MRPAKLVIKAFGPYSGEQTLDFGELSGCPFFLIHGPTGSGKTSILDALCFALYGETSDGTGPTARDGRQMRSHHAAPLDPTEVTFEFTLGSRSFRVTRRPEWERPKRRGDGFTIEKPEATLWEFSSELGQPDGEKVIASQSRAVTEAVEELVGFRSDQFRQVIVLPQGRFREFLVADSKQRQDILQTLFRTEPYRRVEETLKARAKELETLLEKVESRRSLILEQAGAASQEELAEERASRAADLKASRDLLGDLGRREETARRLLDAAGKVHDKLRRATAAQEALALLEAQAGAHDDKKATLARARAAGTLAPAHEALSRTAAEAGQAETELAEAEAAHRLAGEERSRAAGEEARENAREPEREELVRRLAELDTLARETEALARLGREFSQAESRHAGCRAGLHAAEARVKGIRESLDQKKKDFAGAELAAARLEDLQARRDALGQALGRHRELTGLRRELETALGRESELRESECRAGEALGMARRGLAVSEEARREAQAGVLARDLSPGRPCPVCGSTDHPFPAEDRTDAPTRDTLARQQGEVERLEEELGRARDALSEQTRKTHELAGRINGLGCSNQATGEVAAAGEADLASRAAEAVESLEKARLAAGRRETLGKEAEVLRLELGAAEGSGGELERAREALRDAATVVDKARALLNEKEKVVPPELREPGAVRRAREEATARADALKASLETSREASARAGARLAAAEAALRGAAAAAARARGRVQSESELFSERLAAAGFATIGDFEDAGRTEEEVASLDREVSGHEAGLAAARSLAREAGEAAGGLAAPEMAPLEEEAHQAAAALADANQEVGRLTGDLRQVDAWLKDLGAAALDREDLDARYAVAGRLAEVAAGKGKNALGVSFERYVLGTLLDGVLAAASSRLRLMSRGRYFLQRVRHRPDGRRAAGLDLEVYDAHTGTTRPVTTLSGGESFLASLALALGLADVVQSYAGGIRLDTVFIDEGFGSLDPETLDLAMTALTDLQQGGRLVGVISHVPELRERIDARLEVIPGRRGSSARFVVG